EGQQLRPPFIDPQVTARLLRALSEIGWLEGLHFPCWCGVTDSKIKSDLPGSIGLPFPNCNEMSVSRGFVLRIAGTNFPRTRGVSKIARLRYVGEDRFPGKKRRWGRMFLNPFLA